MSSADSTIYGNDLTEIAEGIVADGSTVYLADEMQPENASGAAETVKDIIVEKGVTLLDLYEVVSDPIKGGMGQVFRVHHTSWNADLAMKQPHTSYFQTAKQKENFSHECEAWINLGLHPHIVSCYYVREISGIPSIFAEWIDGGSLKDQIKSGRLYEGGDEALIRVLDIAIQFARGLHYAHEQGLIHQDVKPDNLLLTSSGEAKVADFGIAKARAELTTINENRISDGTMMSVGGGYTPAYCSPEQTGSKLLTRRTDTWSWAVSVLEMFMGERMWDNGVTAGIACEDYFEMDSRIQMPEGIKDLLRSCFKEDESERPRSFLEIEESLLGIYQTETGNIYPRKSPKAASNTADSLNNRALSFLDLGKSKESEKLWEQALSITPNHAESIFCQALYLWRSANITDEEVINRLKNISATGQKSKHYYFLSLIHIERGDAKSAKDVLDNIADAECTDAINRAKDIVSSMPISNQVIDIFEHLDSRVLSISFSPDSSLAVLYDMDKELLLFRLKDGKVIKKFSGYTGIVGSAIFLPSAQHLLTASGDTTIRLWDINTGECTRVYKGFPESFKDIKLTSDGKHFLVIYSKKVVLYGIENKEVKWEITPHDCMTSDACVSSDESLIITIGLKIPGQNHEVKIWDYSPDESIRCVKSFDVSFKRYCKARLYNNKLLLFGSGEPVIQLWNISTVELLAEINISNYYHCSAVYDPNENSIISYLSGKIRIWEVESGRCRFTSIDVDCYGSFAYFNPYNTFALVSDPRREYIKQDNAGVSVDKRCTGIYIFNIPQRGIDSDYALSEITSVLKSLDNETLITKAIIESEMFLSQKDINNALLSLEKATCIQGFADSAEYLKLNAQIGRFCRKSSIHSCTQIQEFNDTNSHVEYVCFSPDGKLILSRVKNYFEGNSAIILREVKTGECLQKLITKGVFPVCFNPDSSMIFAGGMGSICCWDSNTGELIRTYTVYEPYYDINRICVSNDGKTLILGDMRQIWDCNYIKVVSIADGRCIETLHGHECTSKDREMFNNFFNTGPDGSTYFEVKDGIIKIYDNKTSQCMYDIHANLDCLSTSRFSPDGRMIVSAGKEGSA
ncbi:MAG: protein kinase, partial [Oscillospiraceae bacterium]|nr:protein kinase [Oscillospiraceae bacterium]